MRRCPAMDPAKLPALRNQVWQLLVDAQIHRDLALDEAPPTSDDFDNVILHVDGYLCALKDAQIRGGLHVFGQPPADDALVDTVLAVTRLSQGAVPSLRATVADQSRHRTRPRRPRRDRPGRGAVSIVRREPRRIAGWDPDDIDSPTLRWIAATLVPNLRRATDEIDASARRSRAVATCPPDRAARRAAARRTCCRPVATSIPSTRRRSLRRWRGMSAGVLADRLIERHIAETGRVPTTVGLVLWGTAAMRTTGDDIAEALALARRAPDVGGREPPGQRPRSRSPSTSSAGRGST